MLRRGEWNTFSNSMRFIPLIGAVKFREPLHCFFPTLSHGNVIRPTQSRIGCHSVATFLGSGKNDTEVLISNHPYVVVLWENCAIAGTCLKTAIRVA